MYCAAAVNIRKATQQICLKSSFAVLQRIKISLSKRSFDAGSLLIARATVSILKNWKYFLIKYKWKIENGELNICKQQADINQWRTGERTTGRNTSSVHSQVMQTLPAACVSEHPSMGPGRRATSEFGIHADIFRLACLYPSAALALTWSQLHLRMGRRHVPNLGCWVEALCSNESREGCTGLNATPKGKVYLPDR